MILTNLAIAGGALATSVKVYRDQKRKKQMPWTSALMRMNKNPLMKPKPKGRVIVKAKASLKKLKDERLKPLLPQGLGSQLDTRQQQLLEISNSTDSIEISDQEKEINHFLVFATSSLVLTSVGGAFFPLLSWAAVPVLLYLNIFLVKHVLQVELKRKRFAVSAIDILAGVGPIITGHFFACSLTLSLYFVSRKLLIKTEDHSRKSLINVFAEKPSFVWVESDGIEVEVPFEQVQVGDIVIVHAGETISVDGHIVSGQASIDERALTGESQPIDKQMGDQVLASTILLSGQVRIQVEKAGRDTVAAQIGDILTRTADFKSQVLSRSEKIVHQGAAPTLAISALTWPILGVQSAVAVLFASFGYHMRIAGPLSVLNFLRMASENGILIKDGRSIELLSQVDTFVFDKTGTLTEEVPSVGQLYTCNGLSENDLLTIAAAAEYKQAHPIAQAIRREASKRGLRPPAIADAKVEVGYGLKVRLAAWEEQATDKLILVGSARFMLLCGIAIPSAIKKVEESCHEEGYSLVYVAVDEQLGGAIELHPTIRPEAREIIRDLAQRNISLVIISGDHKKPTKKLAEELGIEHYFAEVLPQDKASLIEQLQNEGKSVCFVGDGINDSIALKQANVSISLQGASSIATDTAGIILMDGTLNNVIGLLDIAQNLDTNLSRGTIMTIVPGIICVGGVFFIHLGVVSAILLYNIALWASVLNALLPSVGDATPRFHE